MSRYPWRKPVRIADAIPGTLQRLGLESRFRQSEIWSVWSSVVGPQIARRAQPHAMLHGRLIVHVTDPVWLHHLSMMRHRVMAALNEKLQGSVVRDFILRIGEVAPPPDHLPGPPRLNQDRPPDPSRLARIEALLAPLADTPFREALYRLLVRASHSAGDDLSR